MTCENYSSNNIPLGVGYDTNGNAKSFVELSAITVATVSATTYVGAAVEGNLSAMGDVCYSPTATSQNNILLWDATAACWYTGPNAGGGGGSLPTGEPGNILVVPVGDTVFASLDPTAAPFVAGINSNLALTGPAIAGINSNLALTGPAITTINSNLALTGPAITTINSNLALTGPAITTINSNLALTGPAITTLTNNLAATGLLLANTIADLSNYVTEAEYDASADLFTATGTFYNATATLLPKSTANNDEIYYKNSSTPDGLATTIGSRHFITAVGYAPDELTPGDGLVFAGGGDGGGWVIDSAGTGGLGMPVRTPDGTTGKAGSVAANSLILVSGTSVSATRAVTLGTNALDFLDNNASATSAAFASLSVGSIATANTVDNDGSIATSLGVQRFPHFHGQFIWTRFGTAGTQSSAGNLTTLGNGITTASDIEIVKSVPDGASAGDNTLMSYTIATGGGGTAKWNVGDTQGIYKINLNAIVYNSTSNPDTDINIKVNGTAVGGATDLFITGGSFISHQSRPASFEWVGLIRSSWDITIDAKSSSGNTNFLAGTTVSITRIA